MIELLVLILAFVFGVLPIIGSGLRGPFASQDYTEDLKVGVVAFLFVSLLLIIVFLIMVSLMHFSEDGPTIAEAVINIFNNFKSL